MWQKLFHLCELLKYIQHFLLICPGGRWNFPEYSLCLMLLLFIPARDYATYSCPRPKIEWGKYTRKLLMICPSALFIQAKITNGSRLGNKSQVLIILTSSKIASKFKWSRSQSSKILLYAMTRIMHWDRSSIIYEYIFLIQSSVVDKFMLHNREQV